MICTLCPIRKVPVRPRERSSSPVLAIVGEAPGQEEERLGAPFVGPAGRLLRNVLARTGWSPEDVHFTNRIWCRPPGPIEESPEALLVCPKHYLFPELERLDPKIVVSVGKAASSLFFPGRTMKQMEGRARFDGRRLYLATYHPAHVLRGNREAEERIEETLLRARGLLVWVVR